MQFVGIGRIEVKAHTARIGINPRTKKTDENAASKAKAIKAFKDALNLNL